MHFVLVESFALERVDITIFIPLGGLLFIICYVWAVLCPHQTRFVQKGFVQLMFGYWEDGRTGCEMQLKFQ